MSQSEYIVLIIGMGLATYLPRWLPLFVLAGRRLPELFVLWLDLIPVSLLSALLLPELLTDGVPRRFTPLQIEFLVAIPTFIFALKKKNLAGTVLLGMFLFWLGGKLMG
ncbi:MAG: AzlD domain-containing protein [Chloroflexota bacterium]